MLWFDITFIIVSIALTGVILMQNRSAGLGSAFGGGSEGFHVRRGSEKRIFQATVIFALLFLAMAFSHLFLNQ